MLLLSGCLLSFAATLQAMPLTTPTTLETPEPSSPSSRGTRSFFDFVAPLLPIQVGKSFQSRRRITPRRLEALAKALV